MLAPWNIYEKIKFIYIINITQLMLHVFIAKQN